MASKSMLRKVGKPWYNQETTAAAFIQEHGEEAGKKFSQNCYDPKEEYLVEFRKNIETRNTLLQEVLKEKPEAFLLNCNEDTLRDYLGRHRILPKKLRNDLVLERAFRKTEVGDYKLFTLFEKEVINKGGDVHDYLYEDYSLSSSSIQKKDTFYSYSLENYQEFAVYLLLISLIIRVHTILSWKNIILKTIGKIFVEYNDSDKNKSEIPTADNLDDISRKEDVRKLGSPSFERLRRNILHEMHVERRPLSWFKKRCNYFHNKVKTYAPKSESTQIIKYEPPPAITAEESKENKIKQVMKEAVSELLKLQRSNLSKFHNPDDILMEKLVVLMKKVSNSTKKLEDSDKSLLPKAEPDCVTHFQTSPSLEIESNRLKEERIEVAQPSAATRLKVWKLVQIMLKSTENAASMDKFYLESKGHLKKLMKMIQIKNYKWFSFHIMREFMEELGQDMFEKLDKEISCPEQCSLNEKLKVYKNSIHNVLEMVTGSKEPPKTHFEAEVEKLLSPEISRRNHVFQPYLQWDAEEENELLEHIQRGKVRDSRPIRCEAGWKNSIFAGLMLFNHEIQLMESGRIIIRPQKENRVKIMSGGRMGNEPLYSEYVAAGMLDCVVLGNEKYGPPVETILQALITISTADGVLIIIMNEAEYRFNFLLAASEAKKLGIQASVILAKDNAEEPTRGKEKQGRQGSIGIVLQYKVAAAMASEGLPVSAIARVCQHIGVTSLSCYTKGGKVFIGNGFTNQLGQQTHSTNLVKVSREVLEIMMKPRQSYTFAAKPESQVILLLNYHNVKYEAVCMIIREIFASFRKIEIMIKRVYFGNFAALPGSGFTLSLLNDWNNSLIEYLDRPTTCNSWPKHLSYEKFCSRVITKIPSNNQLGTSIIDHTSVLMTGLLDEFLNEIKEFVKTVQMPENTANQLQELIVNLQDTDFMDESGKILPSFISIGEEFRKVDDFGICLAILIFSGSQEFFYTNAFYASWKTMVNALYRGATSLAGYTKYNPGDGSISDFLLPLATALYKTQKGESPLNVMKSKMDNLQTLVETSKNLGIQFCSRILTCFWNILEETYYTSAPSDWSVVEDTVILALCSGDPDRKRDKFCTEPISFELKSKITEFLEEII